MKVDMPNRFDPYASLCKRIDQTVFLFTRRKAPPWVRHGAFPYYHDITGFVIVVISHNIHKTEGSPGNVALQRGHESALIAESLPARRRWRPQADLHTKTNRC